MSTRTYARDEIRYDRKLVDMLVAEGMATEMNGVYIVKTDEASYIVRPHQIIEATEMPVILAGIESTEDHNRRLRAEALVEEVLTLRHGPAEVRDGEFDEQAREMVAKILDLHHDGEYEHALAEEVFDTKLFLKEQAKIDASILRDQNRDYERAVAPAGSRFDALDAIAARFS